MNPRCCFRTGIDREKAALSRNILYALSAILANSSASSGLQSFRTNQQKCRTNGYIGTCHHIKSKCEDSTQKSQYSYQDIFLNLHFKVPCDNASHLKGRCSAARSSAYFPLEMISLLKPIFSYRFPRLSFPERRKMAHSTTLETP